MVSQVKVGLSSLQPDPFIHLFITAKLRHS